MLGWKGYFRLAQSKSLWRRLDEWIRHRLRAIQLKQWKRGTIMFRELRARGAPISVAQRVAGNSRCWWRNSDRLLEPVRSEERCVGKECGSSCRSRWSPDSK